MWSEEFMENIHFNSLGMLSISGSSGNDTINVSSLGKGKIQVSITTEGVTHSEVYSDVKKVDIFGGDGDDLLQVGEGVPIHFINGGNGKDLLINTAANTSNYKNNCEVVSSSIKSLSILLQKGTETYRKQLLQSLSESNMKQLFSVMSATQIKALLPILQKEYANITEPAIASSYENAIFQLSLNIIQRMPKINQSNNVESQVLNTLKFMADNIQITARNNNEVFSGAKILAKGFMSGCTDASSVFLKLINAQLNPSQTKATCLNSFQEKWALSAQANYNEGMVFGHFVVKITDIKSKTNFIVDPTMCGASILNQNLKLQDLNRINQFNNNKPIIGKIIQYPKLNDILVSKTPNGKIKIEIFSYGSIHSKPLETKLFNDLTQAQLFLQNRFPVTKENLLKSGVFKTENAHHEFQMDLTSDRMGICTYKIFNESDFPAYSSMLDIRKDTIDAARTWVNSTH